MLKFRRQWKEELELKQYHEQGRVSGHTSLTGTPDHTPKIQRKDKDEEVSHTTYKTERIQWIFCIPDTLGTILSVPIKRRCPHFSGVFIEGFHCSSRTSVCCGPKFYVQKQPIKNTNNYVVSAIVAVTRKFTVALY